ncbi:MAG: lysozyme [Candidatus Melainabacteria bacterium]|nr:lysozyme [Candidatus Melainabacteria bacterium]
MTARQIAEELIKHFEGCKLNSYVLKNETWATIGWGHAIPMKEHPKKITQAEADALLNSDINVREVDLKKQLGATMYSKLSDNQLGATLSFKYNCRPSSFAKSTFLKFMKSGKFVEAGNELPKWTKGSGVVLPGLVRRRKCEKFIFEGRTIAALKAKKWFQQ